MEGKQRAWQKGAGYNISSMYVFRRYITSRIWHKDLNGGGHSVGGFAGIIARVGGCGLSDNKLRFGLAWAGPNAIFAASFWLDCRWSPTGGEYSDASLHVIIDHAIVVIPKYIPKCSEYSHCISMGWWGLTYCGGAGAFSITHTKEIWDPRSMWYSSPPRMKASGLTTLKMTFREMVPVLVDTWISITLDCYLT